MKANKTGNNRARDKAYPCRIGITMGDPSGIGPALIAKSLDRLKHLAEIVVIGDRWVGEQIQEYRVKNQEARWVDVSTVDRTRFSFGKIKAEYGKSSIAYLDTALGLLNKNEIDCLVTCPVSKYAIHLAGYDFSGHTEYFVQRTKAKKVAMMLLNQYLKTVLITRHIPLKDVARKLNKDELQSTILVAYQALQDFFAIRRPRIVVCGLNPHASDNGLLGDEEHKVIAPVVKKLKKRIKYLEGPLPADIAIARAASGTFDCAITMYHDQSLIPLKLLSSKTGVNMTLGLPFIRTSPLHGTAYDIAAQPRLVDESSFVEAVRVAADCFKNNGARCLSTGFQK